MSAAARIVVTPEALQDIRSLPDRDVQRVVLSALLEISANLKFGRRLEAHGSTGDLRGCRKVYVDKPTDGKPRFRIVYWLFPSERVPRKARILAVGRGASLEVYDQANQRYNRDRAAAGQDPVETVTDETLRLRN